MKKLLLLLWIFTPLLASAAPPPPSLDTFGQLPVQDGGRLKPLDSFARVMLKRVTGEQAGQGRMPTEWLATLFFTPDKAVSLPLFRLSSTHAAQMLGLAARADSHYSFQELGVALQSKGDVIRALALKDRHALSADEAELIRVYAAVNDFTELLGTFSLVLPLSGIDESVRTEFHLPKDATYLDLLPYKPLLTARMKAIADRKVTGNAIDSHAEQAFARTASRLALQEAVDEGNALVRLVPPAWGREAWLAPWDVLRSSAGSPEAARLMKLWGQAADAYRTRNAAAWDGAMSQLTQAGYGAMNGGARFRLQLEYDYNRLSPLMMAAICYGIGLMLILAAMRFARGHNAGIAFLILGLLLHMLALGMRMAILQRPPVSTLFESLIFVSFVVAAASVGFAAIRRHASALLAGIGTSLFLLLASWVFLGDNDSLIVLVAVLNTNFWLATHVVCITTGYASALVTGALAHIYLYRACVCRAPGAALASLMTLLLRAALIALCFTAIGTMLGGIWADQSWGRFWGWDPKENGALLIVLWLIWLLHGRIAGQLGDLAFACMMALINVIVAVAWIGVNLLGVGLHSYGFTDTAANGLLAFTVAEIAYAALLPMLRHRVKT